MSEDVKARLIKALAQAGYHREEYLITENLDGTFIVFRDKEVSLYSLYCLYQFVKEQIRFPPISDVAIVDGKVAVKFSR